MALRNSERPPRLAPRPTEALRALESLQERERRGVEGEVPWRGWSDSMREAVLRQKLTEGLSHIPIEQFRAGFGSMSAEYVEELVRAAGAVPAEEAERIAEAARQQSAMGQQPARWSKFEHPIASNILMDIAARIEDAITALAMPRDEQSIPMRLRADDLAWSLPDQHRPAIGTLSTGQFMATCQLTADDHIVILVENGLFPLARSLAQVGVLGYQEATETRRLSKPTVQSIADAVATYVALGHTMNLPVRPTPPNLQPHVEAVENAILMFVLAHEYAHILNGDLTAHPLRASADRQTGEHEIEYLADVTGLRLTMAATRSSALGGAALWGPLLFLAGLDILIRADAASQHKAPLLENDPVGPTPFERAGYLAVAVQDSELMDVFSDALRAGLNVFHVVLFAWDIVMPALWEMSDVSEAGGDLPSGYMAEMTQLGVMRLLWEKVRPRLRTQSSISF